MSEVSMSLGRVSLVPRGEYDPEAVYKRLDVVRRSGSSYLALKDGLTDVLPIDGEDWMCVVERSGKSAYEQALDAGLTATEAQFKSALADIVDAYGDWKAGLTEDELCNPDIVYEKSRPIDWMKMPELEDVQDGDLWLLFQWFPGDTTQCSFIMHSNSDIKVEAGRYENGVFTPQEKYTQSYHPAHAAANTTVTVSLDGADFGDMTSKGRVQAMVRVSGDFSYVSGRDATARYVDGIIRASGVNWFAFENTTVLRYFAIADLNPTPEHLAFGMQNSSNYIPLLAIRGGADWFNGAADAKDFFCNCRALIAIPAGINLESAIKTADGGYNGTFNGCYSLPKLPPAINPANVTDAHNMCALCYSIKEVPPKMLLQNVANAAGLFSHCYALRSLPDAMTLESVTNGANLFNNCHSLRSLPPDMKLENMVNGESIFNSCFALRELPQGMTFQNMETANSAFYNCYTLRKLADGTTFENVVNGQGMFQYCYSLRELPPEIAFGRLTNGFSIFSYCCALEDAPSYFPEVQNLNNAFDQCFSLRRIKNLYIPKCANLTNAFRDCRMLEELTFDPRMETWETPQDLGLGGTALSHRAIVDLFNSLPAIETPKTITLTNAPGAKEVTAEDVAIATAKGWKVAGVPAGIATASPGVAEGPEIFDGGGDMGTPYFVDRYGNEYYGPFYKKQEVTVAHGLD